METKLFIDLGILLACVLISLYNLERGSDMLNRKAPLNTLAFIMFLYFALVWFYKLFILKG